MERNDQKLLWVNQIINNVSNAKVYEVGEYVDGLRKGYWKYIFEN